ncbi:xanthine dehydrogenase family protein subunit M [Mesorhizobium sp. BAC0120]|uniref:FAD binding domain-containing protein n=1 Tax=Mesorhizobium sp. BAC0120 TaxID=3090670 RepID=UPI00298C4F45|nr:xanthine dehydrogenase family protein subunit M [Mesorhizobium sp. BAC0120]MDW6026498.1 xanthine dehydrogenase family protein subunit M [Mesorhizobium sp. BAC0120]
MVRYAKPRSVDEALALMGETRWRVLAGGTDFYPALGSRPLREDVLDINGLDELRGICETPTHFVIGARTTWTDIVRASLSPAFRALREAAREIGSVQIQNTGTLAGNLCNASPAADGVPALLILDAELEIASSKARRFEPLESFIRGNRKIALAPDELVTAIRLPKPSLTGASSFSKLGARRYLVISIAMAAVRVAVGDDGIVTDVAVAVGACSAVAKRLRGLEQALLGCDARSFSLDERHFAELAPIDDVRGSADYRRTAAREIVARALSAALRDAKPAKECVA